MNRYAYIELNEKEMNFMNKNLFNKRNITIAAILILFVIAVVINVSGKEKKDNASGLGTSDADTAVISNVDYYTAFRDNRDSVREKEIEYLESILADENTDSETEKEANAQKLEIVSCMESELMIESAIRAKGFTDAAVTFHKGSVNVVVNTDELNDKHVAQILDIVMRETGEPAQNIKISVQR